MTKEKTIIAEASDGNFFDSNLYPLLIRWLPLKEGYKTDIVIYDYNPKAKQGVLQAHITDTQKSIYKSKNVWLVTVTDDISDNKAINTYFIDANSRELLKHEMRLGNKNMVMERLP